MKLIGAGFGYYLNVSRGGEFGRSDGRFHFHFLDGLHAGLHGTSALRECHDGDSVHGGQDSHLRSSALQNRRGAARHCGRAGGKGGKGINSAISGVAADRRQL